jgi:hypothetical protein
MKRNPKPTDFRVGDHFTQHGEPYEVLEILFGGGMLSAAYLTKRTDGTMRPMGGVDRLIGTAEPGLVIHSRKAGTE